MRHVVNGPDHVPCLSLPEHDELLQTSCTHTPQLCGWMWQVSVRILGGLMALGYEIGTIMKRTSTLVHDGAVSVKLDNIEGMTHQFIQVCSVPLGMHSSAEQHLCRCMSGAA